jgi:hypothetical protein
MFIQCLPAFGHVTHIQHIPIWLINDEELACHLGLGGWSQVLSLRRKGIKVAWDERILGRDEFIQRLMCEAEEREKETLRLGREVPGVRKREVVRARRLFCQLAVRRMGYPGAEVARFLGVTASSVNRLAVSQEVTNLKKYLKLF